MEDQDLRSRSPFRQRTHLSAVIASLFASLLFLFGADVSGRSHPGLFPNAGMSRSDAGQATASRHGETRFLVSSEQSARPKLRPNAAGDGCLVPDIDLLWMCCQGDIVQRFGADSASVSVPLPYWSRAPPIFSNSPDI